MNSSSVYRNSKIRIKRLSAEFEMHIATRKKSYRIIKITLFLKNNPLISITMHLMKHVPMTVAMSMPKEWLMRV